MDARAPVRGISMVVGARSATDVDSAEPASRPAAGALDVRLIAAARAAARARAQHDSLQLPGGQCMHAGSNAEPPAAYTPAMGEATTGTHRQPAAADDAQRRQPEPAQQPTRSIVVAVLASTSRGEQPLSAESARAVAAARAQQRQAAAGLPPQQQIARREELRQHLSGHA